MKALQGLYRIVRRDIGRKLIALVLAVGSWFFIREFLDIHEQVQIQFRVADDVDVRDNFLGGPPNPYVVMIPRESLLVAQDDLRKDFHIFIHGPRSAIQSYGSWKFWASVELPRDFCGDSPSAMYYLDEDDLNVDPPLPPGVRLEIPEQGIEIFKADRVDITLSTRNVKTVGELHQDWELISSDSQYSFAPKKVTLLGPAETIQEIRGNPALLQLEDFRLDTDFEFEASSPDRTLTNQLLLKTEVFEKVRIHEGPRAVTVSIELRERLVRHVLEQVAVEPLHLRSFRQRLSEGQTLSPDPDERDKWVTSVTLAARPSFWELNGGVDNLRNKILLYVDLEHLSGPDRMDDLRIFHTTYKDQKGVAWPEEVKIERLDPEQMFVTLVDGNRDESESSTDGG